MSDSYGEGSPWATQLELNRQVIETLQHLAGGNKELVVIVKDLADRLAVLESKGCACKKVEI